MKTLKELIDSKQWAAAKAYVIDNRERIEEIVDTLFGEISNHTRYTASDVTITIRDQNGIDHEISGFSSDDSLSCGYDIDTSSVEFELPEKPTWCGDDLQFKQEHEVEFVSNKERRVKKGDFCRLKEDQMTMIDDERATKAKEEGFEYVPFSNPVGLKGDRIRVDLISIESGLCLVADGIKQYWTRLSNVELLD